jgi:hypothetical protein
MKFQQTVNLSNPQIKNTYRVGYSIHFIIIDEEGKYNFSLDVVSNSTNIDEIKSQVLER